MKDFDGDRWLPLISALTDDYGARQERWNFTIFFLGRSRDYRPVGSPYLRVVRRPNGEGLVTAGLFGSRSFPSTAGDVLQTKGWRKASHKYEADFLMDLDPGWLLSDAFRHGLSAAGTLAEVSADDFLHCHLPGADEPKVFAQFNPTTKGDYVYYHLDAEERTLRDQREALAKAPLDPHLKPQLDPLDRETFLSRHRSDIADVEKWTDAMILEAQAHGF